MDAAERLIAERGPHGVSLREITTEARANSAAIHYYFRRKEDLVEAVIDRRAGIAVQARLEGIEALLARPQPPSLEALILAYISPGLTVGPSELRKYFGRLRARFTHETDPAMRKIMRRHFREPGRRFLEAVAGLLPHIAMRELQWRFHVMIGTLIYVMAYPGRVQAVDPETDGDCYDPDDMDQALQYVVPMLAAIFRAPPSSPDILRAATDELNAAIALSDQPTSENGEK